MRRSLSHADLAAYGVRLEAENIAWAQRKTDRLPEQWQPRVLDLWRQRRANEGDYVGNTWLRTLAEDMREGTGLPLWARDADVRELARDLAASMYELAAEHVTGAGVGRSWDDVQATLRAMFEAAAERRGVAPPDAEIEDAGAVARMMDSTWWVRRLRAAHGRKIEYHAIGLGYVHKRAGCYVSDVNLKRRREQRQRNARALENTAIVNQDGDEYTLAELAELSNANPVIRRAELMTRIRGAELIAEGVGDVAEFWTMTAPSRFHSITIDGKPNPKHDGSTPREAQSWLCKAWARFRAWAHGKGVGLYGFRIAEPHHDGCPHWHLLVFLPARWVARARAMFRRYALSMPAAEDLPKPPTVADLTAEYRAKGLTAKAAKWIAKDEAEALASAYRAQVRRLENADKSRRRHGCKFEAIDQARGGACSYVAKYIAKNIDGFEVGIDLFGNDAVTAAERVEAWAATWGIRQFQQFGMAPVGVWRELRRLREADDLSPTVEAGRVAANVGRNSEYGKAAAGWAAYVELQGGPSVKRKELAMRTAYTRPGCKFDPVEGCELPAENRYGEPAPSSVYGVNDVRRGRAFLSRRFKWERKQGGKSARNSEGVQGVGAALVGRNGSVTSGGAGSGVGGEGREAGRIEAPKARKRSGVARPPRTCVNNCRGVSQYGREQAGDDGRASGGIGGFEVGAGADAHQVGGGGVHHADFRGAPGAGGRGRADQRG